MATLPLVDQQRVQRGLMRVAPVIFGAVPTILKIDLLAAVQAADSWADANAAAYNTALPATFRANATTAQKALLLMAVITMRTGLTWLQTLLGVGVD